MNQTNCQNLERLVNASMDFPPTEDQNKLIQKLAAFTFIEESYPLFVLRGYAGTGKTSVLGAYVKALTKQKLKVRLLAPTGRAAKVLGKSSSREAFTIHKVIYRKSASQDASSGMTLAQNLFTNTVFIVDEASMIGDYTLGPSCEVGSRNLLDDLMEFVYSGKNCRLILLGDQGQLPPVGSAYSPALDRRYLESHYSRLHVFDMSLNQVLRQAENSGILRNATLLRDLKAKEKPRFILTGYTDFMRLPGNELQSELETCYDYSGSDETIILTRSNKRANAYNQAVRGRVLYFEEVLCSGDVLMVVKNNYYWSDDQTRMGFIANGEIMKVIRVKNTEQLYGFEFVRLLVKFPDYEEIPEMEVLALTETLSVDGPSLSHERLRELFFAVETDYIHEKNKRKRYQLILKDPYFNALQIKYAYAVTCHKAQGGQWQNVFIDPGFLEDSSWDESLYRWLYTAVTRASDKVYLLNFPDDVF
jgi:exodeoxyribonuclease-5